MFDLDSQVRHWRKRQERRSSLSSRELDELEDHLRARATLESELNAELTPARAFAIARAAMGEGDAVSRDFAKAGRPRWKKLLVMGWALFGASFLLPVSFVPEAGIGLSRPFGLWPHYGYEVFWKLLVADGELGNVLAALVPLVAMVLTLVPRRDKPGRRPHRLRHLLSVVAAGTVAVGVLMPPLMVSVAGEPAVAQHLGIGFWAWSASFVCAAAALWLRDHDAASVRARRPAFTRVGRS